MWNRFLAISGRFFGTRFGSGSRPELVAKVARASEQTDARHGADEEESYEVALGLWLGRGCKPRQGGYVAAEGQECELAGAWPKAWRREGKARRT